MLPDDIPTNDNNGYTLPPKREKVVLPSRTTASDDDQLAVNLIRKKLDNLFEKEPNAKEELAEAEEVKPRSKHQQFMYELSQSGKSLAAIQTEWHNYYVNLPNEEKHAVWQEFYVNHGRQVAPKKPAATKKKQAVVTSAPHQHHAPQHSSDAPPDTRNNVQEVKKQLLGTVNKRRTRRKQHHGKSLIFGLSMGFLVMLFMIFGFFNERFIAPFITPSRALGSTPIILDTTTAVGPEPKIIIPKINVDIPVVYDEPSIKEDAVQRALEDGVVHYATTPDPGQKGNAVIFGHSSNNILNRGKFKFAFVLLNRLETGDTFMIHKDGVRYIYKVFDRKIVKPSDTSVLLPIAGKSTVTLITCDPPGTSVNRLVVVGEQISPDPGKNSTSTVDPAAAAQPEILPSNSPSLWQRFVNWVSGD